MSALLALVGVLGLVAHVVIYVQTSVSPFVDHLEFYYDRFVIRDGSGNAIKVVNQRIGLCSYATAGMGLLSIITAVTTGFIALNALRLKVAAKVHGA